MEDQEENFKLRFIESIDVIAQKANTKSVKEAEKFLLDFEKSEFSWSITAKILKTSGLDKGIYLYSANILKKKLQYDAHQLPQDEYTNLAELILGFIGTYNAPAVTQQLAIALALLYLRGYSTLGNIIDILEKSLCQDETKAVQVLQIIEMVAAVAYDNSTVIEQEKKVAYSKFLEEKILKKALYIVNLLAANQTFVEKSKNNILLAYQEWIVVSRRNKNILKSLINTDMFNLALVQINDPYSAEESFECLKRLMKSVATSEDWPELFEKIFAAMSNYLENFKKSLNSDQGHAVIYTKLFTFFAKQFCNSILTKEISQDLANFLLMLLDATSLDEFDGFKELESFWYCLANNFSQLDENQQTEKLKDLQPLYSQLVELSAKRICLSEKEFEVYEELKKDQQKKFLSEKKRDRENCKSLLRDCVYVIGYEGVILKLNDLLTSLLEEIKISNKYKQIDIISKTEGIFVCLKTMLKDINEVDSLYIPVLDDFISVILSGEIVKVKLHNTINSMLAYAADFKSISDEQIANIFSYLVKELANPKTADMAGKALISLSSNFEEFILKNYNDFIDIASKIQNNEDLIISIANAVGSSENVEQAEQGLALLCKPYFTQLFDISSQAKFLEDDNLHSLAFENLKRLSLIFAKIPQATDPSKKHMLDSIVKEIFPYVLQLLSTYKLLSELTEELCKMMKKIIKSLGLKFKPYLQEYFQALCSNYKAEIIVAIFATDPECDQILNDVYDFFCKTTISHFENKKFEDRIEIIEDYLGMAFRYTKYKPSVVFQADSIELNFQLADSVFSMGNTNLRKANLLFLERVFKYCYDEPQTNEEQVATNLIVNKFGLIFIKSSLLEFSTYPVEKERNYLIDIIFASFIRMKQTTLGWLEESFKTIPENILTANEKVELLTKLSNIDVSMLNPRSLEDEDLLDQKSKLDEFNVAIRLFEHRCRQSSLRNNF